MQTLPLKFQFKCLQNHAVYNAFLGYSSAFGITSLIQIVAFGSQKS